MSKAQTIRLLHSSMQYSDPLPAIREDAHALFAAADELGADTIGFTETQKGTDAYRAVVEAAARAGWWMQSEIAGDCRFALHPENKLIESGYVHVVDGDEPGVGGRFGQRGIAELTFRTQPGNVVTVHGAHWLTDYKLDRRPGPENRREAAFDRQTQAMIERVELHARGRRLSFWEGDTNLNEERDTGFDHDAIHARFQDAGLVSIWDELHKPGSELPSTLNGPGGPTLDVIGSCDLDGRVTAASVRVLPRRGRHADHLPVLAAYDVAAL